MFLDTGFLPETYALRDEFVRRYDLNLVEYKPLTDPGPLYETDTDGCCAIRKVEPMQALLGDFDAWVSGVRRDQGPTRANTDVVEHHLVSGRPLAKVYPLGTGAVDRSGPTCSTTGFRTTRCSIRATRASAAGRARATRAGEDERAGRWSGSGKTECGLHTFTSTGTSTPDGGTT